jgi:hypothetical protein
MAIRDFRAGIPSDILRTRRMNRWINNIFEHRSGGKGGEGRGIL